MQQAGVIAIYHLIPPCLRQRTAAACIHPCRLNGQPAYGGKANPSARPFRLFFSKGPVSQVEVVGTKVRCTPKPAKQQQRFVRDLHRIIGSLILTMTINHSSIPSPPLPSRGASPWQHLQVFPKTSYVVSRASTRRLLALFALWRRVIGTRQACFSLHVRSPGIYLKQTIPSGGPACWFRSSQGQSAL